MEDRNIIIKLKELREDEQISQSALADSLGVSRQSIISLEQGRFLPSLPLAIDLCNFFNKAFEDIFESDYRAIDASNIEADHLMADGFVSPRNVMMSTIKVNVLNNNKNFVVKAEIPGVDEENVDVEVGDNFVTISGERSDEKETKDEDYYHKETHFGSFSRTLALPTRVVGDNTVAEMKNGILIVTIPKVEERKTKKIKVKKIEKK